MAEEDLTRAVGPGSIGRLGRVVGIVRIAFGVVLFAFVVAAVVRSWDDVRTTVSHIGAFYLVLAEALVLAGLGLSALTWRRALLDLGSRVPIGAASRIYLLGQLGKYVPGSVWALAAQTELGRSAGVPRARGAAASVVAVGVNVVTGLVLGLALVPSVSDHGAAETVLAFGLVALLATALAPPVLTRLVNGALRVGRSAPMGNGVTWRGIGSTSAWSVGGWLSYGVSVWLLAFAVGAPAGEALPLCLAGVPLAITAGFLVVVAPSGIGVREAVLVAALAPVLDDADALAVALVARLLFTIGDLLAAVAVIPLRSRIATEAGDR